MLKKYKKILDLLKKQPKIIKKKAEFVKLVDIYNSSNYLKKISLSIKSFSLLNSGKVNSKNISTFYKNYKIEKNIFFPVFCAIRNKYIIERRTIKLKKEKYIYQKMIALPEPLKKLLKYINAVEKKIKNDNKKGLWSKFFYPTTKNKVDKMVKYSNVQWGILIFNFLDEISKMYNVRLNVKIYKKTALFELEIYEDIVNFETIKKQYRILSMKYHPDKGGDAICFNALKNAKDILLKKREDEIKNAK
ncbi:MAG TPA: DnaJ domain-containing protein [Spirochaetota bacterium]|nr:DnaJ domain-containing protein [Spirochaetota bacterium]